jgi:hypothetical protein
MSQKPQVNVSDDDGDGIDVQSLGHIGRVFGAVLSRLVVPIPTQISHEVLDIAAELCR